MLTLDLFNNDHERRLVEGAVDKLEQRRIDDLAMRMDDLVARAKKADTPAAKAALVKEFQKCKAERDSYFKIKDECMGYGGLGEENHEFKGAHGKLDVERTPGKTIVTRKEYPYPGDTSTTDRFPNKGLKGQGTGSAVKSGSGIASGQGSMRKMPRLDHDANDVANYEVDEAEKNQDIADKEWLKKMGREPQGPLDKSIDTAKQAAKWLAGRGGPGQEGPTYESQKKNSEEVDEGRMGEIDAQRQDLERMTDRQFMAAYGMSKQAFEHRYRTLLKPALDEARLAVGDPIVVTAPNEFEGTTGEIYEFSPSGKFVVVNLYNHGKHSMHLSDVEYNKYADQDDYEDLNEVAVNPQFIIAQVTKILAGEARRMTNAPMAQLLAPVMKEYNLTLQQIDSMVPGGLRKAAGEYGIMMKEGYQDFNRVEPYEVCLAGKCVKTFDYYEDARRFHDNWKKKLYREGNKAKADKITLNPVMKEQGVAETVTDIKSEMAKVYRRLAPKIERYKDSFLAGQLYDELENIAELHGAEAEFKRMMAGARNRAHMDYDTNPGGFQNWFWYLPFGDQEISEESSTSTDAVERAILHRIMVDDKLRNMAMDVGMDKVFQAVEEVAYNVGDVDEIGSSVSAWIHQVRQILGAE